MKLYFVRHGESKHNVLKTIPEPSLPLTPHGIKQARNVANRFRDIPIDVILSSDHVRAQQTAEEISNTIHQQIFFTPLLGEVRRPSEVVGTHENDPETMRVYDIMRNNARLKDWHYSDEENYYDLLDRAKQFIDYLSLFKEENILVVTHGVMLRVIISYMAFGEMSTHELFEKFDKFFKTRNTGITLCESDDRMHWKMFAWNDHAHLG